MNETAKFIFEQTGSLVLNKKQVAKLINKSVSFIDAAIHQNRLEKIPKFTKNGGMLDFKIVDVASYIEGRYEN
jgi:hypothetical protein